MLNKGDYGEYLTFLKLRELSGDNRLLTNLYIPKPNGSTTEIDLLMINEKGIYVFESKNYSGWIFGDEKNKHWTQMLQNNRKYNFYNPVRQNEGHIKALSYILNRKDIYQSYIIFSERCSLKSIKVDSTKVKVLKRNNLIQVIKQDLKTSKNILTTSEIDNIYLELDKFARADQELKRTHADRIFRNNI